MKQKSSNLSVSDLLRSKTFLESLSDGERAAIFSSNSQPGSPEPAWSRQTLEARSTSPWGTSKLLQQEQCEQPRPATANAVVRSTHTLHGWDALQQQGDVLAADNEQLQRDNMLLQKQKEQLQAKITSLQYQVSMLLANQGAASAENSRLAALESLIARLQSPMARVAKVAQDNRVLVGENKQLTAERMTHLNTIQQLQARVRELEGHLLTRMAAASQDAAETAAAAAAAAEPLGALLLPPAGSSGDMRNVLGGAKIGPALQEISALKRVRGSLQQQVATLQQHLSAAERDAQAAAAAAAAERARAARAVGQGQQRLAAAVQRLEHLTAREQQQHAVLQERESYINKLEQCLLDQHKQLTQLASGSSSPRKARSSSASRARQSGPGSPAAAAAAAVAALSVQEQEPVAITSAGDGHASPGRMHREATLGMFAATGADAYTEGAAGIDAADAAAVVSAAAGLIQHHEQLMTQQPCGQATAAVRAAVAKQCRSVMLADADTIGGSPAATTLAASVSLDQQGQTQHAQTQQQQQLSGLQQLQNSRMQHLQQQQRQQPQQQPAGAGNSRAFGQGSAGLNRTRNSYNGTSGRGNGSSGGLGLPSFKATAAGPAGVLGGNRGPSQQHLLQQQRQQRLRELLQQKQQRQRQQPAQHLLLLKVQRNWQQQQQQQAEQEEEVQEVEWQEEQHIRTDWQQLQQQLLQEQAGDGNAPWNTGDAASGEAAVARQHAAAAGRDWPAACLGQEQQQRERQLLQQQQHEAVVQEIGLAGGRSPGAGASLLDAASSGEASEARLVARVLEMQRNLQQLEGQLLQVGCDE